MSLEKPCPACACMEPATLDRLLVLGKRGPRSLAPVFGLDRRDIARHERRCLTGERLVGVVADLERMAADKKKGEGPGRNAA